MIKAYRYRLYPTKEQKILLDKTFGCVRFVWNWALETKIKAYQKDRTKLSNYDLSNRLPKMKEERPWMLEINAQSLQSTLEILDKSFVSFFKKKTRFI